MVPCVNGTGKHDSDYKGNLKHPLGSQTRVSDSLKREFS
jgi:hypothetical protein